MKLMMFRKIKTSCNTKTLWKQFRTFWFFTRFDPITHLQYHIKKTWKCLQNIIFSVNAFENHFPDISQVLKKSSCGPFSGVVWMLWDSLCGLCLVFCMMKGHCNSINSTPTRRRRRERGRGSFERCVWRVVRALC